MPRRRSRCAADGAGLAYKRRQTDAGTHIYFLFADRKRAGCHGAETFVQDASRRTAGCGPWWGCVGRNRPAGRSNQIGADTKRGRGFGQAPVQGANRRTLLRRDRDMECIARPKSDTMKSDTILIREARGGTKNGHV